MKKLKKTEMLSRGQVQKLPLLFINKRFCFWYSSKKRNCKMFESSSSKCKIDA